MSRQIQNRILIKVVVGRAIGNDTMTLQQDGEKENGKQSCTKGQELNFWKKGKEGKKHHIGVEI